MTTRLRSILGSADFDVAELSALRLDGEGYLVDNCLAPLDEPSTSRQRAGVLAVQLGERLIAERRSAAWVWGARNDPPTPHEVCAASDARARPSRSAHLTVREVVFDEGDVVELNGLKLTSPIRTAIDLARFSLEWTVSDTETGAALMAGAGFSSLECLEVMNRRRNLPKKILALQRLELCQELALRLSAGTDAVDVVHGIDAAHRVENSIEMRRVAHFEHESTERKAIA
jgi:hypothetical protein